MGLACIASLDGYSVVAVATNSQPSLHRSLQYNSKSQARTSCTEGRGWGKSHGGNRKEEGEEKCTNHDGFDSMMFA